MILMVVALGSGRLFETPAVLVRFAPLVPPALRLAPAFPPAADLLFVAEAVFVRLAPEEPPVEVRLLALVSGFGLTAGALSGSSALAALAGWDAGAGLGAGAGF